MTMESIVHRGACQIAGQEYEICVYTRNGRHFARTIFTADDVIISDGHTLDEVLTKHRHLLPLAINSRQILREFRRSDEP